MGGVECVFVVGCFSVVLPFPMCLVALGMQIKG